MPIGVDPIGARTSVLCRRQLTSRNDPAATWLSVTNDTGSLSLPLAGRRLASRTCVGCSVPALAASTVRAALALPGAAKRQAATARWPSGVVYATAASLPYHPSRAKDLGTSAISTLPYTLIAPPAASETSWSRAVAFDAPGQTAVANRSLF